MSSFSIDAKQIVEAINGSTSKSLILVDEFGKGTSQIDGQSLVAALLKYWSDMPDMSSPHVLFCSHFYEVLQRFEGSMQNNNCKIDYLTFNFMLDNEMENKKAALKQTLVYLYTLRKGITKSSYAISVASRVGLHSSITERASEIYDLVKSKFAGSTQDAPDAVNKLETTKSDYLYNK
jgi:DNA mismatch repair ATPase MutS